MPPRDFRPKDKDKKPRREGGGGGGGGRGGRGGTSGGRGGRQSFGSSARNADAKYAPNGKDNGYGSRAGKPSSSEDGGWKKKRDATTSSDCPLFHDQAPPKGDLIFQAQPLWMSTALEPLPKKTATGSSSAEKLDEATIEAAFSRGKRVLEEDNARFSALLYGKGGKDAASAGSLGALSPSDARFIADLLSSGGGAASSGAGATLTDRISALTLLIQSSPIHNLAALDRLLSMGQKKSRQEAGGAVRALSDWLATPGGLGPAPDKGGRKLRYFRDQPLLPVVLASSLNKGAASVKAVDQHLALFAFEDHLKKFYFNFLQLLEAQSHDTLPFVRTAAVSRMYYLLRDQSEQEQNLLRLLVNKLGDTEKSVASRASGHLLELLNAHPAMKSIVVREVAQAILRAGSVRAAAAVAQDKGKGKSNAATPTPPAAKVNLHARYYGVLTLNQTMLTHKDTDVANMLVELYFQLFEELLEQEAHTDKDKGRQVGGDAPVLEGEEDGEKKGGEAAKKDKKPRWKDSKKGKGGKQPSQPTSALGVEEAHAKMVAAILAGVRRAYPFARMEHQLFDKHTATLFRVTHSGSFNISIQALQLVFQLAVAGNSNEGKQQKRAEASSAATSQLADRYYRTLYDSLLDSRLSTSSKQAMYLNLLYRSLKADEDPDRKKAFVKRLCQVLAMQDPPFICGALFLLGEMFKHSPGLRGMLTDPEEQDEEEHFVDVKEDENADDDEEKSEKGEASVLAIAPPKRSGYDGRKRDPRFANAQITCLWEIVSCPNIRWKRFGKLTPFPHLQLPLTQHFHPSVALNATQLLRRLDVSSTADLSLHTLSHFLDRFVYRNPKKAGGSTTKGASIMQPAEAAASGKGAAGIEGGVVNLKGKGIREAEYVNSEKFWRKKREDVPVDQQFFHQYFAQKAGRESGTGAQAKGKQDEADDDDEPDSDASEMDEDEIWQAMKDTMPDRDRFEEEMGMGEEDEDEDDEDLAALDYTDSEEDDEGDDEEDGGEPQLIEGFEDALDEDMEDDDEEVDGVDGRDFGVDDDEDDEEESPFAEDEEDLVPFTDFDALEKAGAQPGGRKRGAEEEEEEEEQPAKGKGSSSKRAERKKQRKELPIFASADDYAHMLGASDEE